MRARGPDLRTRGFILLLAAIACAAYIAYRITSGQASLIAWIPFAACAAGALHYFRQSRR